MATGFPDLNRAIEAFEEKQRNLEEFGKKLDETSTSVDSQKRILTVTMDGHGEIADLKFNNTAYRTMPPTELAAVLLETIRKARDKSLSHMQEIMGEDLLPGLDIEEVNAGRQSVGGVLGKLAEPTLDRVRDVDAVLHNRPRNLNRTAETVEDNDGWER
ncbi:YbaB/EbfC family nucleoid-associated protein [Saccharopolyspora gloriosae]|uniref:YbaB/EbfC family nucleoid-associated protein n=1 Tax=Saccharopolyspora gloriosae TaxID=455344 RepID=UPI001FB77F40|nr:YbaB/EbfC family nucleoid-associated protein [Saccharopolyspora gloriosae]